MFGALLRAAPQLLLFPLLAAALAKVIEPILTFMNATSDDMLFVLLVGISNNFVLVGVLGLFMGLLARAISEAATPGRL
jgi:hypothetical protein